MRFSWLPLITVSLGVPAGAVPGGSAVAPEGPPLQAGPHVMVVETSTRSRVPVAGTAQVVTRSLVLVTLSRQGDGWEQSHRVCAIDVTSDTRADTVLPDAFVASMPLKRYPVQLERSGGGWTYRATPEPNYIGFDPSVSSGALPDKRTDPAVVDFEGDGHPGATVLLDVPVFGAVRMYIAQKGQSRYLGRIRDDGSVAGTIEVLDSQQVTLGASVPLFASTPTITPVPEGSRFQIGPSRASDDCMSLRARWKKTFELP